MDAFEFAKKMELDGIKLYNEVLQKTTNESLKSILMMLIKQEKQHYELFDYMKNSTDVETKKSSFEGVKNLFEEMREKKEEFPRAALDFYEKILEVEDKSEKFYREMAGQQAEANVKQQISQIADEEHKHYIIINNIIQAVNAPNSWVESAEFNHLEDY